MGRAIRIIRHPIRNGHRLGRHRLKPSILRLQAVAFFNQVANDQAADDDKENVHDCRTKSNCTGISQDGSPLPLLPLPSPPHPGSPIGPALSGMPFPEGSRPARGCRQNRRHRRHRSAPPQGAADQLFVPSSGFDGLCWLDQALARSINRSAKFVAHSSRNATT